MTDVKQELIKYFETLLLKAKDDETKFTIQKEIDRLKGKIELSDPTQVEQ